MEQLEQWEPKFPEKEMLFWGQVNSPVLLLSHGLQKTLAGRGRLPSPVTPSALL